ncbi:MAG TPA: DUF4129 domain-containing protein [Pirellulales bacterium]|jgi:hypothetical protein
MANSRPEPTLADYMAIAISPALIMVLVSSLAYFLLTVFYAGEFEGRMYWTMTCFVFAAVLISRVSIMEGAERASMFGLALGGVAALAMIKFTDHPWWAWCVLGVIWWCASHLVWNCTLVDDEDDASGEGLLEAAGFDAPFAESQTSATPPAKKQTVTAKRTKDKKVATTAPPAPPQPVFKRFFAWWQRSLSRSAPPGLTVVYFSLAALPIFGLGQHFVGEGDRQYAFRLMVRYVASALGLLLTTSFLGLRRYLRQRRLEMPAEMAGAWLGVGASMGVVILIVAMLIPRPNPEYAISSITGSLGSPERDANSYAPLRNSPGHGDSSSTAPANDPAQLKQDPPAAQGQNDPSTTSGDSRADRKQPGSTDPSQSPAGTNASGQQSSATQQSGQKQSGQQPSGQQSAGQSSSGQQKSSPQQAAQQQNSQASQQNAQSPAGKQSLAAPQEQQSGGKPPATDNAAKQQQSNSQSSAGQPGGNTETQSRSEKSAEARDQTSSKMAQAMSQHAQQAPALPSAPLTMGLSLLSLLRMIVYAVIILVGIYCLVRYWPQVKELLARLRQELMDLWNSLFGGRRKAVEAAAELESQRATLRPFASFADPFVCGAATRHAPNAVVQYSFEALEAWAAEQDLARRSDETPLEFATRLADARPPLAAGVQDLASLYARMAYARETLGPNDLGGVQRLWAALRQAAAVLSTARG